MNMHSLKKLVLPPRVTVLPITMASSCLAMTEFVALGDIKYINANSLQYCSSCLSYDFTACTSVPVLAQTNAFNVINAAAKIYVPATLYDEWIAATNWAVLADYIVGVKALEYTVNDDKTACAVTGIGSYTGIAELSIPSEYKGLPVTAIGASAFEGNEEITSLSIPESITAIGASAFSGCVNLSRVYFNAVNMPNLIYGDNLFRCAGQNTDGIRVVIGNKVERIPSLLFNGGGVSLTYAPKVTSVEFEEGSVCTTIGWGAFYYNTQLGSFTAPPTLESIEQLALYHSTSDATFDFSACLQIPTLADSHVGTGGMSGNPTIYVPAALYDEWITATNWAELADWIVGVAPLEYALDPDGTAYTVTGIGTCDSMGELTDLIIPEKHDGLPVTTIAASAFEGDETLNSVYIPESVTSIGASAFADCTELTRIYFGAANMSDFNSQAGIFARAGQSGDGIKVVIGSKVTRVPDYTFYGGSASTAYSPKVTSVEFEEGSVCTEIGYGAFYYCDDLTSFTAPATLEKIGICALYHSTSDATFDFSACLQIPTLADSHIGTGGISGNPTIYVPAALYDEWITATNWAELADWIVAK